MRDTASPTMPFIDLQAQRQRIAADIDAAITAVLDHGAFVMGPEVTEAETQLAERAGARHCLTCSSGTDALLIPLMAKGIGPGDAVFVPSFTFTSTAEVAALMNATPVFVDVDPATFNIDPESLAGAVDHAKAQGLKPACIIAVDLFGQPADFDAIGAIAEANGMWILDDAAQSFGARYKGQPLGSVTLVTATSFYPSKPLGCYGDGGAVFTDDDDLFARMTAIRVHGQGPDRSQNICLGLTARFDSIQAAVLLQKLKIFDDECETRNRIAERYNAELDGAVSVPRITEGNTSVWAQYTIRTEGRDRMIGALASEGVPTAVFYARPLHTQAPYAGYPVAPGGLSATEKLADEVLSLPMHPYLDGEAQGRIIAAVRSAAGA